MTETKYELVLKTGKHCETFKGKCSVITVQSGMNKRGRVIPVFLTFQGSIRSIREERRK